MISYSISWSPNIINLRIKTVAERKNEQISQTGSEEVKTNINAAQTVSESENEKANSERADAILADIRCVKLERPDRYSYFTLIQSYFHAVL